MRNYEQYFLKTQRVTGKEIVIVDPDRFECFLDAVACDLEMDNETKAFLFLSLSGGLRVSEVLELKKSDFTLKANGNYSVQAVVLKKRAKVTRSIGLHPLAKPFIDELLSHKRYNEFVLYERANKAQGKKARRFTRHDITYRLERAFGTKGFCNHSTRHSLISFLLARHNKSTIYCSTLLKVSPSVIARYGHLNGSEEFDKTFSKKGA